jgi:hypothetical protein
VIENKKLINGPDQEVVARLTEVDMIVADLERANSRVVAVERRNAIISLNLFRASMTY